MGFLKKGKKTEEEFSKLFKNFKTSTKHEDINEHWDLEINHKIDVKGLKKIKRSDSFVNENFHWIEIRGVKDDGWLYGGKADFFAFETIDYWIIVDIESLKKLIKLKTQKIYVTNQEDALYKLYSRRGRNDILTLVKTIDLIYISTSLIKK